MDIQSIAEDSQREDSYSEGIAAIVRVLKDLGDDLIVIFCLRLVSQVDESAIMWNSYLVGQQYYRLISTYQKHTLQSDLLPESWVERD